MPENGKVLGMNKPVRETNLRMVIVDYLKLHLQNQKAFDVFGEVIKCRQDNYLRTADSFLVLDRHDMIGTHVLIYDFSNPFERKLVAGVRVSYESRAREHDLDMPVENLLDLCPPEARTQFEEFRKEKGPTVQLNTLFVDPEYSLSRSGLRLSEVLFFGLCSYIRRLDLNHFLTAPNDQLKTDRWVKLSGIWSRPTFTFNHPDVNAQHTLYFIDSINDKWLAECITRFEHYWTTAFEFVPPQLKLKTFNEIQEALPETGASLKRTS